MYTRPNQFQATVPADQLMPPRGGRHRRRGVSAARRFPHHSCRAPYGGIASGIVSRMSQIGGSRELTTSRSEAMFVAQSAVVPPALQGSCLAIRIPCPRVCSSRGERGGTHFTTESINPEEGSSVKRTVTFCHGVAVSYAVDGRGEGGIPPHRHGGTLRKEAEG